MLFSDKTVNLVAADLLHMPELCNKWTLYTTFYVMHVIHRPKFIIKIGNIFLQINQFISTVQNFISLNLKETSMRFAFFPQN